MMDGLIALLKDTYCHVIREPVLLSQVCAHEVNSKNYYVRCGGGSAPKFVLKEERLANPSALGERLERLELHAQLTAGRALVPALVPTANGRTAVTDGNCVFSMTKYCAGTTFPGTPTAVTEAGHALANLHRDLADRTLSARRRALIDDLSEDEGRETKERLRATRNTIGFFAELRTFVDTDLERCRDDLAKIEGDVSLPRQLVHWDFHPSNALFEEEQVVAILDLDSLSFDFRMQAVAFAAARFCGRPNPWPFLLAYHGADPVTPGEIRWYPEFVQREAVRRINWLIRVNVLLGKDLWRSELTKHIRHIRESRSLRPQFNLQDPELMDRLSASLEHIAERQRSRLAG